MRIIIILLILFIGIAATAQDANWLTNLDEAKALAATEDKQILLSFSGSDWCANCMRLEHDIFAKPEFQKFAESHFVLVNLDFPARKKNKLTEAQTAHNEEQAERYNRKGEFPLVLILDSQGKQVGRMVGSTKDIDSYLSTLKSFTL